MLPLSPSFLTGFFPIVSNVVQSLNLWVLISLAASAQLPEDHKSRRTVDSILAMVIDYERELLNQFPIPPATR